MLLTSMWLVDTVILLVVTIFLFVKYMSRNYDYWKLKGIFYLKPMPVFGNFFEIATFRIPIGQHFANIYNSTKEPYLGMFIFGTPHLVLRDPDLIKQVLVKDFQYFNNRTFYVGDHEPLSQNLMFMNIKPEWKQIRAKMTPVFTTGKLKGMFPLMETAAEEMKTYLHKYGINQEWVEIKEISAKYSTDVIASCAFGINAHSFDREDAEFRSIGRTVFDFNWSNAIQQTSIAFYPGLTKLLHLRFLNFRAEKFLTNIFWSTIKEREKTGFKRNDLIDCLIELRQNDKFTKEVQFDNQKILAQAVQFFLAGFETTSSIIAFALYELCIAPDIQQRVRDEIKAVIEEHGKCTYENILNMKYLHMCVSETLRKYPVLPFLDRRCNTDYKLPGTDLVIEKGTPVLVPMFGLHYDPQYFADPDKFDPERFSDDNIKKIVPFSYIPFGEGPRICIGERFGMLGAKVGLVHLLSEFELIRTKQTSVPPIIEPKCILLLPRGGLKMKVARVSGS